MNAPKLNLHLKYSIGPRLADIDNSTMKNHGCAIIESVHHSGRPILVVATKKKEQYKSLKNLNKYTARLLNN